MPSRPLIISTGGQMPIMMIPLKTFPTAADAKALTLGGEETKVGDQSPRVVELSSSSPKNIKKDYKHHLSEDKEDLLHSGPVLGNLPSITPSKSSPQKQFHNSSDVDAALSMDKRQHSLILGTSPTEKPNNNNLKVSLKADEKYKKHKKSGKASEEVPPDMPKEFICQLTHKPMSEPVKTVYGNIYDKAAIYQWFSQQGRICPLTGKLVSLVFSLLVFFPQPFLPGAPLAEIDLIPMPELENEIRQWILKRSLKQENENRSRETESKQPKTDDLYDF
jgi:hypothetical protein